MTRRATVAAVFVCALFLISASVGLAQSTWVDELTNSLSFYKTNYPTSNWQPYEQKLIRVKDAVGKGDQQAVRMEMNKFFRMLQRRENGISDVAADELYNFALMVTPIQEYGISVPQPPTGVQ